jgi:hypothetical protein
MMDNRERTASPVPQSPGVVQWSTSGARSSYCTVAVATGHPEGVTLNFGISRGGERHPGELTLDLLHQLALNPRVAKRLHEVLGRVVADHDARGRPALTP